MLWCLLAVALGWSGRAESVASAESPRFALAASAGAVSVDESLGAVRLQMLREDAFGPVPTMALPEAILRAQDGRRYPLRVAHDQVIGHRSAFVVLVDRSASMFEPGAAVGMREVIDALTHPELVERLFPEALGGQGAVLLLTFADDVRGLDGEPWTDAALITDRVSWLDATRRLASVGHRGWTRLYDAVSVAMTQAAQQPALRRAIAGSGAGPGVLLITDGYHNTSRRDTCASNAPRLDALLGGLRSMRGQPDAPELWTVGLGAPTRSEAVQPAPDRVDVDSLCGQDAHRRIDGDLEGRGSDAVSLRWLAEVGGGEFVEHTAPGALAAAMARAGGPVARGVWLEADGLPSQVLRQPAQVELRRGDQGARGVVRLVPHPWWDVGPGALRAALVLAALLVGLRGLVDAAVTIRGIAEVTGWRGPRGAAARAVAGGRVRGG